MKILKPGSLRRGDVLASAYLPFLRCRWIWGRVILNLIFYFVCKTLGLAFTLTVIPMHVYQPNGIYQWFKLQQPFCYCKGGFNKLTFNCNRANLLTFLFQLEQVQNAFFIRLFLNSTLWQMWRFKFYIYIQ
jgi:hypothetical protein